MEADQYWWYQLSFRPTTLERPTHWLGRVASARWLDARGRAELAVAKSSWETVFSSGVCPQHVLYEDLRIVPALEPCGQPVHCRSFPKSSGGLRSRPP